MASVSDMRPGSLVRRRLRCGKSACHCVDDSSPAHGPYWYLTRTVGGKTVTHSIPASEVERIRQQIAEYKRFRALAGEFVDVSEKLCQAQLSSRSRRAS